VKFGGKNLIEKIYTFECGFDPVNRQRIPFSMQFFIIAILFLIFDMEISIILPLPLMEEGFLFLKISIIIFVVLLILGLLFEWSNGLLKWTK